VSASGLATLDTAGGRATVAFAAARDAEGRLSGRLLYADLRAGVLLTGGDVTALSVSGDTVSFAGTGRCLDRGRGAAALRPGPQSEEEALQDAGQQAIRQEVDRLGQACAFSARATDGGPNGQGDAFTIEIGGGAAQGGAVRRGEVRVESESAG
jgi:hypothetical protein